MPNRAKVRGVNFGNWLVLEKWMSPGLFAGTNGEDETDLCEMLPRDDLLARLKQHRDTYITQEDFTFLANCGINVIRVPVPYFIFDDYAPFVGCIEYLDKVFEWAQHAGVKILIDLHTAPDSQNGFDNGGLCGVCKFHLKQENVDFAVGVLERLAIRYKNHAALYGMQFLNEPISPEFFDRISAMGRYPARDAQRAKGSEGIPTTFLYDFYTRCYHTLRKHLDDDVVMMFHDGFRLNEWNDFMRGPEYKNVVLDTHIYIGMMLAMFNQGEMPDTPEKLMRAHVDAAIKYIEDIKHVQQAFPVVIGEWSASYRPGSMGTTPTMEKAALTMLANLQLYAWEQADGWFFWSYKLHSPAAGWDFGNMVRNGYFPPNFR